MFVKNGVVLHHLATLFDNANAVSKPEHDDQSVHGVLYSAKRLRNPAKFTAKLQFILSQYCRNPANLIHQTIYFNNEPNANCVT